MDDPYKFIRDLLINDAGVVNLIPPGNIRILDIPETMKAKTPYIRLTVLDTPDLEFGDGDIRAAGVYYQIDIWQTNGLLTLGNNIKKLLKQNDIRFVDSLEPHTEKVADNVMVYRDARRYFYAYELKENEIY
ncbi:DUF3168 domain-containing protein [Macrococcus equipercicus]|uniref:DUF3168 domain-containing protein n=1 Tax=Macrococcus equipercicus TaxID=69967 RepID=A0A9Q9BSR5_9STAP|nr:DUF3168 domain-containing protein [Macrococcus equipercicus]UTH13296.1 hypothetical protein KFV11_08480 [Macrococcus equipercicus]